eukprot:scaffold52340_cov30-Tisochrysis_lutea.AAC.1
MLFLNGLNPVPAYRDVHSTSWARKGVRAADLLPRDRWVEMRALFHISSPLCAPVQGRYPDLGRATQGAPHARPCHGQLPR